MAENGHATVLIYGRCFHLFYQARNFDGPWRYRHAQIDLMALQRWVNEVLNTIIKNQDKFVLPETKSQA